MSEINYVMNFTGTILQRECATGMFESVECAYKLFCPQLPIHFVKIGVIILISSFLFMVLSNFFINKWYKKLTFEDETLNRFLKLLDDKTFRYELMFRIRDLINGLFLFYIIIVIYFNI